MNVNTTVGIPLNQSERETVRLIALSHTTSQIAKRFGLTIPAVSKMRQRITNKTGIHKVADITRYAASKGLIEIEISRGLLADQ
jgi:two-component system response regulator NreC